MAARFLASPSLSSGRFPIPVPQFTGAWKA